MRHQTLKKCVILLSLLVISILGAAHADADQQKSNETQVDTMALYQVSSDLVAKWPRTWYKKGQEPETLEQRDKRLRLAAMAAVNKLRAAGNKFLPVDAVALVLTVWFHESAGEYYVHAGGISPLGDQDGGAAKCMGQIQTWKNNTLLTPEEHKSLPGIDLDATERCAAATISYFWAHRGCVKRDWSKPLQATDAALLFAAYGEGKCMPVDASARIRAHTWTKTRAAINAGLQTASKNKQAS